MTTNQEFTEFMRKLGVEPLPPLDPNIPAVISDFGQPKNMIPGTPPPTSGSS